VRGIYPTAKIVTAQGITDISDDTLRAVCNDVMAARRSRET